MGRMLPGKIAILLLFANCQPVAKPVPQVSEKPSQALPEAAQVTRIQAHALAQQDKTYADLTELVDNYPQRLSGSDALEQALAWAETTMRSRGHENVRKETIMVPRWIRGNESLSIAVDGKKKIVPVLGLGGTIATEGVLTAPVLEVKSFDDLKAKASQVKGKIVLFNTKMPDYDAKKGSGYRHVVGYRIAGASVVAEMGAVGMLLRSLTNYSLQTPHTGMLLYDQSKAKVPAAAITVEESERISRALARGAVVEASIKLSGKYAPERASGNVIGELVGSDKPQEVVLIGAHMDSWDVGQGAHDDAGGCIVMMRALDTLRTLKIQPKRTIRVVLFTNEENGVRGGNGYAKAHAKERHVVAMESDSGVFRPRGFHYSGPQAFIDKTKVWRQYLAPLGADETAPGGAGVDVTPLTKTGVPGIGIWVDTSRYFDIHHTEADTLDKVEPRELAKQVALVATLAYLIANETDDTFAHD